MNIHYYLPLLTSFDELRNNELASIRLRAAPAIAGLLNKGHAVTFGSYCADSSDLDIAIFGKLGSPENVPQREILWGNEIRFLKNIGTKIIMDYSDHHLGIVSNQTNFYKKNINLADFVTVPSKKMAELVEPFSKAIIQHIPDAIEFDTLPPRKLNQTPKKILWFGAKSNLKYLFTFIEKFKFDDPITIDVLTDAKGIAIFKSTSLQSKSKIHINLNLWSFHKMVEAALISDMCIIPSDPLDIRKNGVGSNRLITALALGLPVAASNVNSYTEFSKYFVDINSSNLNSLIKNPNLFHESVLSAQETIVNQFSFSNIERIWCEFIERLVLRDASAS
jgi:glycosyltransferase involved in cell wall biosynthesis